MNSEVELHDAIQELRAVATAPDLYPIMVELQSIGSLLGLLSHDNTDISVAVVDLLQELTDVDTLHESVEGTAALVQDLSDNQVRTFFNSHTLLYTTLDDVARNHITFYLHGYARSHNLLRLDPFIFLTSYAGREKKNHVV